MGMLLSSMPFWLERRVKMALLPFMVAWVMLVCNGICVGNNIFILPVEGKKSLEVKLIV